MDELPTVDDLNNSQIEQETPQEVQLPIISGNDFIDATQNAIVDAAENVSEALTLTESPATPEEHVRFYQDAEFWVGMSFVVVVVMIAKPMWRLTKKLLQQNAENVVSGIKEAAKLRDDAQKLLSDYMRRCSDVKQRVAQISEQSRIYMETYREQELKNLQRDLDKKQREVQIRIDRTTQIAKDEINASVSARAISLAKKTIEKHLNDDDKTRLIDEAIAELDKIKV